MRRAKLKVLPLRRFFPEDLAYARARLSRNVELLEPAAFDDASLEALAPEADVLLGGRVSPAVLAAAKRARLLQVPWAGVDTLDFLALKRAKIAVCNSHSNAGAVAEYGVALLLSLLKGIPLHDRRLRVGAWLRPRPGGQSEFSPPRRLAGMSALFVGYGRVAQAAAGHLSAFGMTLRAVAARGRARPPRPLEALKPVSALDRLLPQADVVFVAAPLTPETRGLFDARRLALLRAQAVLVNVARAELLDEGALYAALKDGRLAGAALDAWTRQPSAEQPNVLPSDYPFHELDNVVLSPHRAGFSAGELPHWGDAIENLNRLAAGKPPANRVDLEAGY